MRQLAAVFFIYSRKLPHSPYSSWLATGTRSVNAPPLETRKKPLTARAPERDFSRKGTNARRHSRRAKPPRAIVEEACAQCHSSRSTTRTRPRLPSFRKHFRKPRRGHSLPFLGLGAFFNPTPRGCLPVESHNEACALACCAAAAPLKKTGRRNVLSSKRLPSKALRLTRRRDEVHGLQRLAEPRSRPGDNDTLSAQQPEPVIPVGR